MQGGYGGPPGGYGGYGAPGAPGQGGPPQGYGAYGGAPRQYEFSETENATIRKAAGGAKFLAIAFIVGAVISLCNLSILNVILYVVFAVLLFQVNGALSNVVTTSGNDITHMMDAVRKIGTVFKTRLILLAIGIVLLVLVGVAAGLFFLVMSS